MLPHRDLLAQEVRGILVNDANGLPLPGAIVQLLARRDAVVSSTLCGTNGAFRFVDASSDSLRLRVLRIGYRPYDTTFVAAAEPIRTALTIRWSASQVTLAALVTRKSRTCRVLADSGARVLDVWSEARKALLTASLAERIVLPLVTRVDYERELDSSGTFVRAQRVKSIEVPTMRAYASLPPDSLARIGFATEDSSGVTYFAPDAGFLVADVFAATHCFNTTADVNEHPGEIGLTFEPTLDVERKIDIRGTFWLNRATSLLRSIDFFFTNLPSPAVGARGGGRVDFARLSGGELFVNRWHMRMPRLETRSRTSDGGMRRTVLAPSGLALTGVVEVGGLVQRVSRADSVEFVSALPRLQVTVRSSSSLVPRAGAHVRLSGTDYAQIADSAGVAVLAGVLEGRYIVEVRAPSLAPLGDLPATRTITVTADAAEHSVELPSPDRFLKTACGAAAVREKTAVVFGVVADTTGRPQPAVVTVRWPSSVIIGAGNKGKGELSWIDQTRGALAGGTGTFVVCNVPRQGVVAKAEGSDGRDERFIRIDEAQEITELRFVLRRQSASPFGVVAQSTQPTRAFVEFHVLRDAGTPMAKETLWLSVNSSPRRKILTDELGRMLLLNQDFGITDFVISSDDDRVGRARVTLAPGRNVVTVTVTSP